MRSRHVDRPPSTFRSFGLVLPEHEWVEPVGGGCIHAGDDVLVGAGGEGVGVVPEPFLDDLDVDAAVAERGSRACA